jgi:hypothetical protein
MKAPIIILGLLVLGLGFGYYKRNSSAREEVAVAVKEHQSLSNQVAELRTRLALEQGTGAQSQSNLNSGLNRRTAELMVASNRLVQVNLLIKAAQSQGATAQTDLQSKAAKLALLENERDDLKRQLTVLPKFEKQISEAKQQLTKATSDREFLLGEVRRLQVEKSELMSKLDDVSFLRIQLTKAEQDAELQRSFIKAGRNAALDRKSRLELQQDGTVRPVAPAGIKP